MKMQSMKICGCSKSSAYREIHSPECIHLKRKDDQQRERILKDCRAATSGQRIRSLSSFSTESTEVTSTATGQQVLQKHEVNWA